MSQFKAGWYLIYTRPNHEKKVHTRLTEQNINSFLPLTRQLSAWKDRKKYVDKPLFPSYVFIYLNDMRNYYDGMDTEGSLYYVKTGKDIARVSDSVVDSIKVATAQTNDIEVTDNYFEPGRKLVISEGALTGLSCEVVKSEQKEKLLVRVDLLQRSVLLTLNQEHLMAG